MSTEDEEILKLIEAARKETSPDDTLRQGIGTPEERVKQFITDLGIRPGLVSNQSTVMYDIYKEWDQGDPLDKQVFYDAFEWHFTKFEKNHRNYFRLNKEYGKKKKKVAPRESKVSWPTEES